MRITKVGDQYVSVMYINNKGKPSMMVVDREEAIKLGHGLLTLFGISRVQPNYPEIADDVSVEPGIR